MRVDRLADEGRVAATWLPFELHPETPREGAPLPTRVAGAQGRLAEMGAAVGLVMRPQDRLVNTRLALATAEFARERGRFAEVHHALLRGHWERTVELDRVADLQRIVAEAGLDPAELAGLLAAGRYEPLLDRHRADASAVGISAIPAHIVGQRYLLVGAQPYETFVEVLDRLAEERSVEPRG